MGEESLLTGRTALVTGGSRGIGRGIAISLARAGATVYLTGRTEVEGTGAVPLAGSIYRTVDEIVAAGGSATALRCDHRDDDQVRAVFARIRADGAGLDLLVNNAWRGYEGYSTGEHPPPDTPFWDRTLGYWDANLDGVRWAYVASALAAPMLIESDHGAIVNVSFNPGPGNPAYGVAKTATDRLTLDAAHELRPHGVPVLAVYPGLVRTESVMLNAQYFDMSESQSPEFVGRAVAALVTAPDVLARSGTALSVTSLAQEFGLTEPAYMD
jgi:NAD(P)-dependent dehydrogenase (short-subunit alcohol dehydrogenase family)